MTYIFNSVTDLYGALQANDYLSTYANCTANNPNMGLIFQNNNHPKPVATTSDDFNIPGIVVETSEANPVHYTAESVAANNNRKPSKNSTMRASAKDIELLKKHNASFDKNDPNAAAQFIDGNVGVYISAANSRVPMEGDTLDAPDIIKITDNSNGHKHAYHFHKLTPENSDGKHFAKAGKNMHIDKNQFEEGKTYYILFFAVDEDTHSRLDLTDHLEIYRLDFSYNADTDTCNYDLIQEANMQGSGRSSIDYSKR